MVIGNATVSKGIFTKEIAINYTTTKTFNLKEEAVRDIVNAIQKQINK